MQKREENNVSVIHLENADFSLIKKVNHFQKEKELKKNIYYSYQAYIDYLESLLGSETEEVKVNELKFRILKLKDQQGEYYEPSTLELACGFSKEKVKNIRI
ncbi:MAG: hypothetical protein E7168_01910 [Firmicutes bacterium]|nr:hypothetical protein [Bacillota bacterium]